MNTFPKAERLCSRRVIEKLYAEGHRCRVYPYSVQGIDAQSEVACQVMTVAPKRRFRHAVDRNRIKRLTRECYRTRKQPLIDALGSQGRSIAVALVYIGAEMPEYHKLGQRMDKVIATLIEANS